MLSAVGFQFLFKLSGTSHDNGERPVRLHHHSSRGIEQITRTLAPRKLRCVKDRWSICRHIVPLANFGPLLVVQRCRRYETLVVHGIGYEEYLVVGYTHSSVESCVR